MKIAVASEKGGTGKTTVVLGLAASMENNTVYVDCDVEEANAIFFSVLIFSCQKQSILSFLKLIKQNAIYAENLKISACSAQ